MWQAVRWALIGCIGAQIEAVAGVFMFCVCMVLVDMTIFD